MSTLRFISFFGFTSLLIFFFISSSPVQESLVVHSQIHILPQELLVNGDADPDHTLSLTIHLVSNNMSGLEQELYAVSNPDSPRYGKHLSKAETESFVCPSKEASATLDKWLADHGIKPQSKSSSGNIVKIQVPVKKANKMFNTTFQSFTHTCSNQTAIRAMKYSLPAQLLNHTESIYPITNLPKTPIVSSAGKPTTPSNATFRRGIDPGCEEVITPACVRDLYNIPSDTTSQETTDGVGVLVFNGANVKGVEAAQYLQANRPDVELSDIRLDIVSINGGDDSQSNFSEVQGSIDTQTVLGLRHNTPITIYPSSGEGSSLTDLLDTLNVLLNQDGIPSVLSLTSLFLESTEDSDIKVENAICLAIMQLGVQGVSFIASSGDRLDSVSKSQCSFLPNFPASCPYVTSVGATTFSSGVEIGSNRSAGSFSNVFPTPSYQANAVNDYLKQIGSLDGEIVFNASGRGFPDVAIITGKVPFIFNGAEINLNTTISNGPTFAAIIADLNAQRQSQGKSSLGFLNPLLYSNPQAFNDITQGNGTGCTATHISFPVTPGWDAVTGLGSPNYTALLEII